MPKIKRTAAEVLDAAEDIGWESLLDSDITNERVYLKLQPGTNINYFQILDL